MLTSTLSVDGSLFVLCAATARTFLFIPRRSPLEKALTIKPMIISHNGITPRIARSAFIAEGAHIIGDVHIGEHSSVWFNCVLRGDCYHIRIGMNTNVQDNTVIHVTPGR